MEQTIQEKVSKLEREVLEEKFINLMKKYETLDEEKKQLQKELKILNEKENNQPIVDINEFKDNIDFSNRKIKRRQQYLHKTYTKTPTALNHILNELIEKVDPNLQKYFNILNKKLELIALENNDMPLEEELYNKK